MGMEGESNAGYPSASVSNGQISEEASASSSSSSSLATPAKTPAAQVFDLSPENDQDDEELLRDMTHRGSEEWYGMDDTDANEQVQQKAAASSDENKTDPALASKAKGAKAALGGWASNLRQKASVFGSKAAKALAEEAKLVKEDVRDIAGGVREGMQLTKQDLEAQSKVWKGVLGGRFRTGDPSCTSGEKLEKPEEASAPSDNPGQDKDASEVATAPASSSSAFQSFKQNLAVTAEASKEMWKDIGELKQEVLLEVRATVTDIRHVVQNVSSEGATGEANAQSSSKQDGGPSSTDPSPKTSPRPQEELEKGIKAVFRSAGEIRGGLWQRFQGDLSSPKEAASPATEIEQYLLLPSTRANYAELCLDKSTSTSSKAGSEQQTGPNDAVNRVRMFGGRIKGKFAEASSGIASIARDVGKEWKTEESPHNKLTALRPKWGESQASSTAPVDEAFDGDAIFEIGSDDAWSDLDDADDEDREDPEVPSTKSTWQEAGSEKTDPEPESSK
eukprot:TRINITY_DN65050_c0_g1_i1.p1 TRINITY_DN65050_c0_g1~~TRINITY_DN65050_c0_g1_i1.p1  ORF type:complete len:505 (+),score=140.44 TRINITY_DN65050_c0_g1_i1:57-1571(+)